MYKCAILCCLAVTLSVKIAHGDWLYDLTSERCSEPSRYRVATLTRQQIEFSVKRAEASINPPASIDSLSCLDSLMQVQLGSFAPTGPLGSIFSGTLSSVLDPSGNVAQRICSMAEREWRKITRSLNRSFNQNTGWYLPSYLRVYRQSSTQRTNSTDTQLVPNPGEEILTNSRIKNKTLESPVDQITQKRESGNRAINMKMDGGQSGSGSKEDTPEDIPKKSQSLSTKTAVQNIWESLYPRQTSDD